MVALWLTLCISSAIEVNLAPDQPLPFVYADDPLIVEIVSNADAEAMLHISVQRDGDVAPAIVNVGPVRLREQGPYWWAIRDLPPLRGYYQAKVRVELPDGPVEQSTQFCRIDRPAKAGAMPVCAMADPKDSAALIAIKSAGVRSLRLDANSPEFATFLDNCLADGCAAVALLDATALQEPGPQAEALARTVLDRVARWDIRAANARQVVETAEGIRRGGSAAPIALVVSRPDELGVLFENGSASQVRELVIEAPQVTSDLCERLLHAARRTGVERWRFHALLSQAAPDSLLRDAIQALGYGCVSVIIAADAVYDGKLNANFGRLNGVSKRLAYREAAGPLALPAGSSGFAFRDHNQWLIALWAEKDAAKAAITLGKAGDLHLSDAYGNDREAPAMKEGAITFDLGPEPLFLSGKDGALLGNLARNRFSRQARAFHAAPEYEGKLPPELLQRVRDVAAGKSEAVGRAGFLFLLRAFPVLEQAWHEGVLPKDIAAPALGELADLMRTWCTVQEDAAEPFVTPMSDHMEKCEEYRALYLTGAEAGERGDWLLDEVLRLMNEADALAHSGKNIEGTALVAMAEWRARALDSAAKAPPLSEPVDQEHLSTAPVETGAAPIVETVTLPPAPPAPEPAPVERPATPEKIEHVVARGDNPSVIANKYKVGLEDLLKWNNLTPRSTLHIGDKLVVYPPGEAPEAEPAPKPETKPEPPAERAPASEAGQLPQGKMIVHTVKRGDNPSAIANKYGVPLDDFMRWNNLNKRTTLRIGQELVVYVPERRR